MITPHRQHGVAVITALLIVALAATISAGIATSLQLEVRRTGNLISTDQAIQYIKTAEKLAMNVLAEDGKNNNIDHLEEGWAMDIPPFPVDGGQIIGKISDLQARMNINNIVTGTPALTSYTQQPNSTPQSTGNTTPPVNNPGTNSTSPSANSLFIKRMKELLEQPEISINSQATDAMQDWIDTDTNTQPYGAEDGYYLYLEHPYRAANQSFKSISTLRLVRGFEDAKKFEALLPFISAIDGTTDININTAPAEVLLSLDASITKAQANTIISAREATPFETVNDMIKAANLNASLASTGGLSVNSNFFLLTSNIEIGNARRTVYSIIYRDPSNKTSVISRMQNSL